MNSYLPNTKKKKKQKKKKKKTWNRWCKKKVSLYRDEIKHFYIVYMEENFFQDFLAYTIKNQWTSYLH